MNLDFLKMLFWLFVAVADGLFFILLAYFGLLAAWIGVAMMVILAILAIDEYKIRKESEWKKR